MKAKITRQQTPGRMRNSDVVSIFDSDGREIAIRRGQIPQLIKLLKDIRLKSEGSLELLEYCGKVW